MCEKKCLPTGTTLFGCRKCDFDLCAECYPRRHETPRAAEPAPSVSPAQAQSPPEGSTSAEVAAAAGPKPPPAPPSAAVVESFAATRQKGEGLIFDGVVKTWNGTTGTIASAQMALKLGGSALVPVSTVDNPALNLVVGKFVRFTIKGGSSNSAVIVSDQSPPLRKAGTMLLPKLFGAAKTAEVFTPAKPKGLVVPPKLKTTAEPPTSKATIEPTKPKVLSTNSQSSYTDFVFPGAKPIAAIKPAGMVEPKAPLKIVLPVRQSENASASAANVEAEEEFTGEVVMFHSRKGFGQICCDTPGKWFEKDILVKQADIEAAGLQRLANGDRLTFRIRVGTGEPSAHDLVVLSQENVDF